MGGNEIVMRLTDVWKATLAGCGGGLLANVYFLWYALNNGAKQWPWREPPGTKPKYAAQVVCAVILGGSAAWLTAEFGVIAGGAVIGLAGPVALSQFIKVGGGRE